MERALELAQRAAGLDLDLDGFFHGVRIAEEVRERLSIELEITGIQGRGRAERRPLDPRVITLFMKSLTDDDAEGRERAAWRLGAGPIYLPCTTLLLRVPTPEISISYMSPGSIAWVLPIVPDQIRSPGSRVKYVEM